ncbi:acyl-CoA dehydrogenase family protein [Streptomyces sp. NBC_01089]|uniref:acyl-CoA dehydrogenase family protein n=1 Tax=Streptomyces sp. NBC_01089 TaxID=2903747 RepID=UPI0038642F16|nr:acyl-CoA dehydrogenase family protein [Streptomyces sp. NBC_01089]
MLTFEDTLAQVARRRAEFTAGHHVPRDMIEEFKRTGIYRAATPKRFGGDALPPSDFLRAIERISEVDGSAGWVASFGSASVYLAALPLDTQADLYADGPDVVFAGGLFPLQPAEPVDGGFKVSGRWKFSSGCKGADVLGVGIGVGGEGPGKPRTAVLRPSQVEIVENWDVVGLEGTGSHDLSVDGVTVPEEWTFVRGGEPTVDEPLYRYPTVAYAAQVLAVVNLGVARAALDHAIRVGSGAGGITGAPVPADRPYFRTAVARAEAELRSVRAFFYEMTDEVYEAVAGGATATDEQTGLLRLAAAHAAKVGFDVVRAAYNVCGTAAIHAGNPMQRYLRDASVVPQHAFLTEGMYDGAGAVLTGVKPFPGFV